MSAEQDRLGQGPDRAGHPPVEGRARPARSWSGTLRGHGPDHALVCPDL